MYNLCIFYCMNRGQLYFLDSDCVIILLLTMGTGYYFGLTDTVKSVLFVQTDIINHKFASGGFTVSKATSSILRHLIQIRKIPPINGKKGRNLRKRHRGGISLPGRQNYRNTAWKRRMTKLQIDNVYEVPYQKVIKELPSAAKQLRTEPHDLTG